MNAASSTESTSEQICVNEWFLQEAWWLLQKQRNNVRNNLTLNLLLTKFQKVLKVFPN